MVEKKEFILARKRMLDDQLEKLKNRMTGRDNSFYPFITNRSGEISERKLEAFIKELTDKPMEYTNSNSFYLSRYEANRSYKRLCKCFLYCAIQGIAVYNEGEKYAERSPRFFSDITDIALHKNNLFLMDENTLHSYEFTSSEYDLQEGECRYYSKFNEGGFFRNADMAYYILTGKHIVSTFPKDEYRQRLHEWESEIAYYEGYNTYEDYLEAMKNAEDEYEYLDSSDLPDDIKCECIDEDEWIEEIKLIEKQKEKNEEWKKTVVSPENYVKNYLDFRKLFFALPEYKRKYFFDDIVLMVDVFLYEHGLSPITNDELYAEFDDHTDRLCAMMKRKPRKRGE